MNKKKILWCILLVILIIGVVAILVMVKPKENVNNTTSDKTFNKSTNSVVNEKITENLQSENNVGSSKTYQKTILDDGILYSVNGENIKSDIVITTSYYDTTITDIYLNPEDYYNKNIEVEGFYLENSPWTFVGRYSTSNLCVYCPTGYSYIEYQLSEPIDENFIGEETWIKVIGTLKKGNDESSDYQDYYYLEALSLEIMNEKGTTTVSN